MNKPVLDLDQLEYNGNRIYDAQKQGTKVWIRYVMDDAFKEITCHIDEPMDIWDMVIKCSTPKGKIDIPFHWIVQVESV